MLRLVEVAEPVSRGGRGIVCSPWTCGTWYRYLLGSRIRLRRREWVSMAVAVARLSYRLVLEHNAHVRYGGAYGSWLILSPVRESQHEISRRERRSDHKKSVGDGPVWFRTMCLILRAPETSFIAIFDRWMVFYSAIHSAWCVSKQRGIQQTRTWSDTQSLSRHLLSGFEPVPCVRHQSSLAPRMNRRSPRRCSGRMRGPVSGTGIHLWKTGTVLVTWREMWSLVTLYSSSNVSTCY